MEYRERGPAEQQNSFDEEFMEGDDFDQDSQIEEIIANELLGYAPSDRRGSVSGAAESGNRNRRSPAKGAGNGKASGKPGDTTAGRPGKRTAEQPGNNRAGRSAKNKAGRAAGKTGRGPAKGPAKKKSGALGNFILVMMMLVGLGLIAYPRFSDWWNNLHQSRAIAGYVQRVANMDKETFDRLWGEAEHYNELLRTRSDRFTPTAAETAEYEKILDVTGTGIMGYIDIPKIKVSLPVYHGTDEAVLQIAIGHIEGTSFPVGGYGTHCALSGHRGLPSARLFTDIDQLVMGDQFFLQILDRTLAYEVDQVKVVLPDEMRDLDIDADSDFCTLITCTPYGVNTHRMLVRGRRVEVSPGKPKISVNAVAEAILLDPVIMAPLVVSPLLLIIIINLLITTALRRKELRDEWE